MSARSSARTRACRSSTRSRAIRSHHGPSNSTMAAMTSSYPAQRPQQGHAAVRRDQPAHAAEQQQAGDRQPDRRSAVAGSRRPRCFQRLDQLPQGGLLLRAGVPPDQRESGHAEHLRPGPADGQPSLEHAGHEQQEGRAARPGRPRGRCPRVRPGPAADARVLPGRRDQQPGRDVQRHGEPAGHDRDQHEHDPHGVDAEAPPRRHAGRPPRRQPVGRVPAQRLAVAAVRSPTDRRSSARLARSRGASPNRSAPCQRAGCSTYPIIAPRAPTRLSGTSLIRP